MDYFRYWPTTSILEVLGMAAIERATVPPSEIGKTAADEAQREIITTVQWRRRWSRPESSSR